MEKKQGVLPKTLSIFYILQIHDLTLSGETGSNSHKSPVHQRKLFDVDFTFLEGQGFPLRGTSPESPPVPAVVIFP